MSVAAQTASAIDFRHRFRIRNPRFYYWIVSFAWLTFMAWDLFVHRRDLLSEISNLIPWLIVIAIVNLFPLWTRRYAYFTPDDAIAIAAMLALTPTQIGVVVFCAAFDPREFKRDIAFHKALFNRSQVAAAIYLGSLSAHVFTPSPSKSVFVLAFGFLALTVMTFVNYVVVGLGISLEHRYTIIRAIQQMKIGSVADFALTLASWAVIGVMLAVLYDRMRLLGLLAFLVPTLLGRQVLARSQMFIETRRAYRSREAALVEMGNRIHQEREDERKLIAASLHDEVLQPLYKVNLMANVVKTELATGRLLEADEDLPELLSAAEVAANALRGVVGDLRRSAIGRGGLGPSLFSLARSLQDVTPMTFHSDISQVATAPKCELVLYQVAKEALTNAATHSHASNVWLELRQLVDCISLSVRDDGIGFDPLLEREGHYGMAIMRERALSVGGQVFIDSMPGRGTQVSLTVPLGLSE